MSSDTSPNNQDQHANTKEIDSLIDRKIESAKLVILEKRFNYFLSIVAALLAIFGILLPLYLVSQNNERVDKAIEHMENNFKELAGKQLRKPKIICRNGNELLLDSVLHIKNRWSTYFIQIHNDGDGVAGPIDAYIYFKDPNSILDNDISGFSRGWNRLPSEDIDYESKYSVGGCEHLSPQDIFDIPLHFPNSEHFECRAMLKVFYGEPTPVKIPFVFLIEKAK